MRHAAYGYFRAAESLLTMSDDDRLLYMEIAIDMAYIALRETLKRDHPGGRFINVTVRKLALHPVDTCAPYTHYYWYGYAEVNEEEA